MRLVLVDHCGERVRGDSAVFAAASAEWAENTFSEIEICHLALVAARIFDESEGRRQWTYFFAAFGPKDRQSGYDVFRCDQDLEEASTDALRDLSSVLSRCSYMGYVRCVRPVISIFSKRRHQKMVDEKARAARPATWASRGHR